MKEITSSELDKLRFPAGKFVLDPNAGILEFKKAVAVIESFPELLAQEIKELDVSQLNWKYRPEGWRIYEVIHHCVDSHMNAFIRFKKALAENPADIAGYQEHEWTKLWDAQELPITNALEILKPLHFRWAYLINKMTEEDFQKGYFHPENQRVVPLSEATMLYKWHCTHHLSHVRNAKSFKF